MSNTDACQKVTNLVPGEPAHGISLQPLVAGPTSVKVQRQHLERLAVAYVRQSSPHKVQEHRESRALQYDLADYAVALGWPSERILVIDDDQGQSSQRPAEERLGFQLVVAEVPWTTSVSSSAWR
jgi:hypothetical protein